MILIRNYALYNQILNQLILNKHGLNLTINITLILKLKSFYILILKVKLTIPIYS